VRSSFISRDKVSEFPDDDLHQTRLEINMALNSKRGRKFGPVDHGIMRALARYELAHGSITSMTGALRALGYKLEDRHLASEASFVRRIDRQWKRLREGYLAEVKNEGQRLPSIPGYTGIMGAAHLSRLVNNPPFGKLWAQMEEIEKLFAPMRKMLEVHETSFSRQSKAFDEMLKLARTPLFSLTLPR
jgi:hypothetical protein